MLVSTYNNINKEVHYTNAQLPQFYDFTNEKQKKKEKKSRKINVH